MDSKNSTVSDNATPRTTTKDLIKLLSDLSSHDLNIGDFKPNTGRDTKELIESKIKTAIEAEERESKKENADSVIDDGDVDFAKDNEDDLYEINKNFGIPDDSEFSIKTKEDIVRYLVIAMHSIEDMATVNAMSIEGSGRSYTKDREKEAITRIVNATNKSDEKNIEYDNAYSHFFYKGLRQAQSVNEPVEQIMKVVRELTDNNTQQFTVNRNSVNISSDKGVKEISELLNSKRPIGDALVPLWANQQKMNSVATFAAFSNDTDMLNKLSLLGCNFDFDIKMNDDKEKEPLLVSKFKSIKTESDLDTALKVLNFFINKKRRH